MSVPLLLTKLYIPSPGKYLVGRSRLLDKLSRCLEPGCRLALVSAPAGFGKTSLIAAWLAESAVAQQRQVAWLSLDEGDNDPVIFWSYLITALQTVQAGVGQSALDLLAAAPSAQSGDLERKLAALINDLAQISQPTVVVLDDYHLIRSPLIHQSLAYFIDHAPPHIHLLIASRTDPPLPLALLRGRGRLLEIRLNDLRFSDADADAYLNAGMGLRLAAPSIQALNQKTEGWIAGLQMAALAMQDQSAPGPARAQDDFVASFSGSNRFILDYLIEEVLNRQPEAIQQFLVQTSLLDQLCAPLCDALLEGSRAAAPADAQSALRYLESSNLFIVPMDQQRYWYRYHHLFADLLRKRLTQTAPERIPELHRRAIAWYEQNGLIPSAIQHAFQMRDFPKAAALVAQITEELWGRGEHATLLAWMDALPDEEKQPYPHLLTFQVSMLISAGKLREAEACIPILERHIAAALAENPNQTDLIGQVSTLRTYIASFYNDLPALFTHAHTALQNLPRDEDAGRRCGVALVLGHACLTQGALEEAARSFVQAIADGKKARKPHMVLSGLANLAEVLVLQGRLSRAAQVCQEGFELVRQIHADHSTMAVEIALAWGEVLRERGDLAEAETTIRRGLELAQEQEYIWQIAWGRLALAHLLLARGLLARGLLAYGPLDEAETAAQSAEQWISSHPVPEHSLSALAGLLAEIYLRQGKITQAERGLQARGAKVDDEIRFPRQPEYLAWARLAWLRGDFDPADRLLERSAQQAAAGAQVGVLIEALLLRALLARSRGRRELSLALLQQALEQAEPEGYIQTFVAEGQPAAVLLREAAPAPNSVYVARLLAAFPETQSAVEQSASAPVQPPQPPRPVSPAVDPLVEPLSPRELETLRLIAEGYSNKEIAQKLSLSLRTVKYYSTGLYNKLGVDSRMQAVNRARELGLL